MRVCLFVSVGFDSRACLEESFCEGVTYIAYMSRGSVGGADACIKAFAMDRGIQSCPFICSSFSQLAGMGSLFDRCVVLRRVDDVALEKLALAVASVFSVVEDICYNPVVAHFKNKGVRKLSTIAEE